MSGLNSILDKYKQIFKDIRGIELKDLFDIFASIDILWVLDELDEGDCDFYIVCW